MYIYIYIHIYIYTYICIYVYIYIYTLINTCINMTTDRLCTDVKCVDHMFSPYSVGEDAECPSYDVAAARWKYSYLSCDGAKYPPPPKPVDTEP